MKTGVVFDCDSTLCKIEGIDELAHFANCVEEVSALTNQAMDGQIALEEVYERRLQLIKPQLSQLISLADLYIRSALPEALPAVQLLQQAQIPVAIVSGGLLPALIPLACHLKIADLFAVPINFNPDGTYLDLPTHPLTQSDGKAEIITHWKQAKRLDKVFIIGDGMSDAAGKAEGAGDIFYAFTGIVAREKVIAQADFVSNNLLELVRKILAEQ